MPCRRWPRWTRFLSENSKRRNRGADRTPTALLQQKMAKVEINIKEVAHLARLALTPAEEQKLAAQLESVLEYMEKLNQVDVSRVEPMAHAFPLVNVMRADEIQPSMSPEEALRNAPAQARGLFIVPKIVE